MKNRKTFIYVVQVKNRGRTDARVLRVMRNGKQAHAVKFIGVVPLYCSRPPEVLEQKRIIDLWLTDNGLVTVSDVCGIDYFLEAV